MATPTETDLMDLIPPEAEIVRRIVQEVRQYPRIRQPLLRFLTADDFDELIAMSRENADGIKLILERMGILDQAVERIPAIEQAVERIPAIEQAVERIPAIEQAVERIPAIEQAVERIPARRAPHVGRGIRTAHPGNRRAPHVGRGIRTAHPGNGRKSPVAQR